MRLTDGQIQSIRRIAAETAGPTATVRVFGSRLRDEAVGGDLDLLVELSQAVEHPAALSARLATRISHTMHGRRVDVVLLAPNLLRLPIHEIALAKGQPI
jgi:predicted nucleotidyltransferase